MGFGNVKPAPEIRPRLNVGCLFDQQTGRYFEGPKGEMILNGGMAYFTGVAGEENTFKSTLMHFLMLRSMGRYKIDEGIVYDTEMSLTYARLNGLASSISTLNDVNLAELPSFVLTDMTTYSGNKWWAEYQQIINERKADKKIKVTTPFKDSAGSYIKVSRPSVGEVDSLSMFNTDNIIDLGEKEEIGSSKRNTEAARLGMAKSQMLRHIPALTAGGQSYLLVSAHLGKSLNMDEHTPPPKVMQVLKQGLTFKNVPENFRFLPQNLWLTIKCQNYLNPRTKAPEWPREPGNEQLGDSDLKLITLVNGRGKDGPSGMPFNLAVSQADGILVGLSELLYLRSNGGYGIEGSQQSYFLTMYPDVKLSRTTARMKIREDERLQRALEFCSELCQMSNGLGGGYDPNLICDPTTLYEDLKKQGHDWNRLLDTRGWWVYKEYEEKMDLPFLSTYDLLRMRAGKYIPYWYTDEDKKKLKT